MALTDPQSIKISGTTTPLPRTSTGDRESTYESADGLTKLALGSKVVGKANRLRQTVRVDVSKVIPTLLSPTTNEEAGMSVQLVFDRPASGYTNADAKAVYDGFIEALQASSSVVVTKLLGKES